MIDQLLSPPHCKSRDDDLAAAYIASTLKLLKQDKDAEKLIAGPQAVLVRSTIENAFRFERYYDPLVRDATTLYLLAKHFPERARALPPEAIGNILRVVQRGWYNTLSSSWTILALDAYGTSAAADGKLSLNELHKDNTIAAFGAQQGSLMRGTFTAAATGVSVHNDADLRAWYAVTQSGFDRTPPTTELKQGIEIVREYTDESGKTVTAAKLGEELDVHIKIRATESDSVGSVAIVDLLPGGFEPVLQPPSAPEPAAEGEDTPSAQPAWRSPIGTAASTWALEYADVREDRVVIYGTALRNVQEFVYKIRATNAGAFVVPPAYGESLYDRNVQARSLGAKIEVTKK